jgi:flagellum-specific peptidoglycan hydrolase FlgJ
MTDEQQAFIRRALAEAIRANHPFALMAACEAALECTYGRSLLALQHNNLFGMKQHKHPTYGTATLPTREFLKGRGWVVLMAPFVKYPDWRACFADRLVTLERLAHERNNTGELAFPHYAAALAAQDAVTYVSEVSQSWSTDPDRALKCIAIYHDYMKLNPSQEV